MFSLTSNYYLPNDTGLKILHLLASGLKQDEVATELDITPSNLRHRITKLKLNLGVTSTEQLLFEYGKYIARQETDLQNKL